MAKKHELSDVPDWRNDTVLPLAEDVEAYAWAVDAACSGNPGPMEYQAVDLQTGARVFHFGPMYGTNNIGEFLAIVHALALIDKQGDRNRVVANRSPLSNRRTRRELAAYASGNDAGDEMGN